VTGRVTYRWGYRERLPVESKEEHATLLGFGAQRDAQDGIEETDSVPIGILLLPPSCTKVAHSGTRLHRASGEE